MTHYRPVALIAPELPPVEREAPLIQWVALADLVVDDRYQRPLTSAGKRAIARMAAAFDWGLFGVLSVSPIEGGRFAIRDGQHRAHAARLAGIAQVPCLIVRGDLVAQARAFVAINTTAIRLRGAQVYRAALAGGLDWAVRAEAAVAAAGMRIVTTAPSESVEERGAVRQVMTLRRFIEDGRDRAITRALEAMADAGCDTPDCLGPPLRMWIDVVAVHPEMVAPRAALAAFLAENDIADLYDRCAATRRELAGRGETVAGDYRARLMAMLRRNLAAPALEAAE